MGLIYCFLGFKLCTLYFRSCQNVPRRGSCADHPDFGVQAFAARRPLKWKTKVESFSERESAGVFLSGRKKCSKKQKDTKSHKTMKSCSAPNNRRTRRRKNKICGSLQRTHWKLCGPVGNVAGKLRCLGNRAHLLPDVGWSYCRNLTVFLQFCSSGQKNVPSMCLAKRIQKRFWKNYMSRAFSGSPGAFQELMWWRAEMTLGNEWLDPKKPRFYVSTIAWGHHIRHLMASFLTGKCLRGSIQLSDHVSHFYFEHCTLEDMSHSTSWDIFYSVQISGIFWSQENSDLGQGSFLNSATRKTINSCNCDQTSQNPLLWRTVSWVLWDPGFGFLSLIWCVAPTVRGETGNWQVYLQYQNLKQEAKLLKHTFNKDRSQICTSTIWAVFWFRKSIFEMLSPRGWLPFFSVFAKNGSMFFAFFPCMGFGWGTKVWRLMWKQRIRCTIVQTLHPDVPCPHNDFFLLDFLFHLAKEKVTQTSYREL